MSIFFKARGTGSFGILVLRLILGTYTLSLGITQANNIQQYIDRIKSMGIMGDNLAFIAGFVLPLALIVFGALYIMGFFTPISSLALASIALAKILAGGIFPTPGIPFNKDIIFFACFFMTLFTGAGIISFDAFLDKKKKKVKPTPATEPPKTNIVTAEVVSEKPKENPAP
jgi:uncharacterized membrane protein YphA (DoxX/SURF4 family)